MARTPMGEEVMPEAKSFHIHAPATGKALAYWLTIGDFQAIDVDLDRN